MNDLAKDLKNKYNITPRISENYKQRYKKYHRACFKFDMEYVRDDNFDKYLYSRKDIAKSHRLRKWVNANLKFDIAVRNEWSCDFVYFNDLTYLLDNIPKEFRDYIHSLEIMDPALVDAQNTKFDDQQIEIAFCTKLPFDKYRYQVYIVTNNSDRNNIGYDNLLHLRKSIEAYNGIKSNNTFAQSHKYSWWVPETYFYSETLDWLPIIRLMEPRYIKKIKQFKTLEEVQNENST
jgi:hypothetical protein